MTNIIDTLRRSLAQEPAVRLALLFGSVARGTDKLESDADLAVQVPDDYDLAALASRLSQAVGREVDVISLRDPGVPMIEELLRDAVVVRERDYGAFATWRSHALLDREIDLPWYTRMRDAWLKRVAERGFDRGQP